MKTLIFISGFSDKSKNYLHTLSYDFNTYCIKHMQLNPEYNNKQFLLNMIFLSEGDIYLISDLSGSNLILDMPIPIKVSKIFLINPLLCYNNNVAYILNNITHISKHFNIFCTSIFLKKLSQEKGSMYLNSYANLNVDPRITFICHNLEDFVNLSKHKCQRNLDILRDEFIIEWVLL